MLAYNVKLSGEECCVISSWLLVRTLDQAQRLARALNDAQIGLIDVDDPETIEHLNSEQGDAETDEYIAAVLKRKN